MWSSYVSWGCTVVQPFRAWPTPATQDTGWAWWTQKWNSSLTQRSKVILELLKIVWYVFFLIALLLCETLLIFDNNGIKMKCMFRSVLLFSTWWTVPCYGHTNTYILCVSAWRGERFRSSSVRVWVRRPPPASSQRCSCTKRSELHTPLWIQCGPSVF